MARRFALGNFLYAHRGLWTGRETPENSLAAFEAASALGLGLEFDIRPASGGELIVFHDQTLTRMAGRPERVEDLTLAQLQEIMLTHTQGIPSFTQLLSAWPQDLPLLTEMKVDGRTDPAEMGRKTGALLEQYEGLAAAMSFSEEAVRAVPESVMRGQVVLEADSIGGDKFEAILARAVTDGLDYIAVNIADVAKARALVPQDYPLVAWTVRSVDEVRMAVHENVAIIFEHLDPALVSAYAMP